MCLSLNYNREKGRIQERKKIIMKKYTPSDLLYYFAGEKKVLLYVTISGLIYNVGMTLSPWFEGQLAQYVIDILGGERAPSAMLRLASLYLLTIMIVQGCRALKRLYERHLPTKSPLR